ncbi:hypothetical protein PVK06_044615 [Gossypium arboreum]|uniref:Uncharacterized protein n=1 Tax=Gossypium arboreum TaxID=29729 RepID=A0ABR0MS47_GOSAR|nr:hypothetical protein PVK06_044615 [Gossypium arboreum]
MAVYINLERPLVSQILIDGRFQCRRYGHVKDNCSFKNTEINMGKDSAPPEKSPENHSMVDVGQEKEDESYGPWIIVERRQRQKSKDNGQHTYGNIEREKEGPRTRVLINRNSNFEINYRDLIALRQKKGKDIIAENSSSKERVESDNGRQNMESKNNGKAKMLGSKINLNPLFKDGGLIAESSKERMEPDNDRLPRELKKNGKVKLVDPKTSLDLAIKDGGLIAIPNLSNWSSGLSIPLTNQACSSLDITGQEVIAQNVLVSGSNSNTSSAMGKVSNFTVVGSLMEGQPNAEVVVEVGSLDSDKHSAVVFSQSKDKNSTPTVLKANLGLNQGLILGSRGGVKAKSRGALKKFNKMHVNSGSRFKSNGNQRVLLKDSMAHLAENISSLIGDKSSSNGYFGDEEQQREGSLLGQ